MTKLKDILNITELAEMIRIKRINVQYHPTLPLRIFNYSNQAQFAGEWSNAERVCRGLIVDNLDNVVARGPSKFFNYGQTGTPEVALDEKVWVSTKADGSLGIGWCYGDEYGIATRGSFTSEQALKATAMLEDDMHARAAVKMGAIGTRTPIFEIVYPENRIVLDYNGLSHLISLGKVNKETGLISERSISILYGEHIGDHEMTFAEALALPIPDDEEGYVVDIVGDDNIMRGHIKLKGENYIRLHGAIFGLSERKIWEVFGQSLDGMNDFIAGLPDELQPWAVGVANRLEDEFYDLYDSIVLRYNRIETIFGRDLSFFPRGDVAREFMQYPDIKGPLFSLLDGNDQAVREWVHKQIKPAHKLFRTESEDTN